MSDFFQLPQYISKADPTIIEGEQIIQDIEDNKYDSDLYDNKYKAMDAAQEEMREGYTRRYEYLNKNKDDEELNAILQKHINANIAPVPATVRKKVTGTPEQRAVVSKTGFGKVKEKYRVFKRSFKNKNASVATIRESSKLKAYKTSHDAFDRQFENSISNLSYPYTQEEQVNALRYFVDRKEVKNTEERNAQNEANKELVKAYIEGKEGKKQILNNACKELINFEMEGDMFTDEYLSANITSLVEMTYKFRAFKTLYEGNRDYFKSKAGVIDKLIIQRGNILENFVTEHLHQQGLQIDWNTKTTTTIVDKVRKTSAEKNQARNDLVSSTVAQINSLKDASQNDYIDMISRTVSTSEYYESKIGARHKELQKMVANNPVVYHYNKALLRKITGKAARYAEILQEMEKKMDAYQKLADGDENSLDETLTQNAAAYLLQNLKNQFTKDEEQYRAYELTIISMVDGNKSFNSEETFLINDTIEKEKIDRNLTELRVRKDYHEVYYAVKGEGGKYSNVHGEFSRRNKIDSLKGQYDFIKDWYKRYNEGDGKEEVDKLQKNNEIDPYLSGSYDVNDFKFFAAPEFEKLFLPVEGDTDFLKNYHLLKRMAEQYDFIQKNSLLRDKPKEIVKNVMVNGQMAKHLLKGWEPYIYMIKTGIHLNLPLDADGKPRLLNMSQEELKSLAEKIKGYKGKNGKLPKHMQSYLELTNLQLTNVKANDSLTKRFKGLFQSTLRSYKEFLELDADNSFILQKLYAEGAENVTPDTIRVARAVQNQLETDEMLDSNMKEELGLELFMAIKPLLKEGAIDPNKKEYDLKGNLIKDYSIVNNQIFEENMRIANLFRLLWHESSSLGKGEEEEIDEIMANYYRTGFNKFNQGVYDVAIKGYTSEDKISKRIEKDTKYIQRAMGKNALTKLIQKMMESGVGFGKLNTEEYADMMKDGLEEESQKAINDFNNYLEQSGFNTNFTLKKK